MKKALWLRGLMPSFTGISVAFLVFVSGCGSRQSSEEGKGTVLLAEFKGGKLLESDLPREVVFGAEDALYRMKLARTNEAVEKKVLERAAGKEGVSVEEFVRRRVTSRVSIYENDLKKEYVRFMESRLGDRRLKKLSAKEREAKILEMLRVKPDSGKTFQALVTEYLRGSLSKRKEREALKSMVKEAGLRIYLTEPEPPTYHIPTDGEPALGPATVPVTVVVFSDFQCPFCAQAGQTLKKLVGAFPGKVRLVFRNYPLPMHGDAQGAAEAAACAHEQGRFWEYHDLLFANQKRLGAEDLKQYAARLGLNMARFGQGLQSVKYAAKVRSDLEEGRKYGIRGTPAVYINGQPRRPTDGDYFWGLYPYIRDALAGGGGNVKLAAKAQPGILAEVAGLTVTEADLPKGAFYEQEERLYQARLDQVKKLLETKLVALAARKRGVSPDSLYHKEIATTPMPQELKAQFAAFHGYVSGNPRLMRLGEEERKGEILKLLKMDPDSSRTYDTQVMRKLGEIVRNRRLEQGKSGMMARLMAEYDGRIHLVEPRPPTYEIATEGYPSLGSEKAPVTIVEFADFQCPYCQQASPVLNQVLARYSGKVRVVFRSFPLPMHADAHKAHEAAECAREQGKFWEYHDVLFTHQNALEAKHLKQYAADMGLDLARFSQCLDSGKHEEKVKKDAEEGRRYNVRGTPSFFINGTPRKVQTFEQFAWHITGGKEGKPAPSVRMAGAGDG